MLLFTDRDLVIEGRFGQMTSLGICKVMPLKTAPETKIANNIIVCDVDLESFESAKALKRALAVHRSTDSPVVFLLRDHSFHNEAQASALGADDVVDGSEGLEAALSAIVRKYPFAIQRQSTVPSEVRSAVDSLLKTETWTGTGDQSAMIETGAAAVLDAVETNGIQSWLGEVWAYDDLTYQHCLLVAGTAAAFATSLGLSRADKLLVTTAGLVHDVGKAFISKDILNKDGPLDAGEMDRMRRHPQFGYAVLKENGIRNPDILDAVRYHHEMLDGAGYPVGLKGSDISNLVRMITISDVFSALIERRAYKKPLEISVALDFLRSKPQQFDQALVRAFAKAYSTP